LAVFRKSVWASAGGYDTNLKGNEDWDFWLTVHGNGVGFHFIDAVMFDYRVKENSVSTVIKQTENYQKFLAHFCKKHGTSYREAYCKIYSELEFAKEHPLQFLIKQRMGGLYVRMKKWQERKRES
jgi:hypothetical protein